MNDGVEIYRIIQTILDKLFTAERRRLSKMIDSLCEANQEAHGQSLDGFKYQGISYRHSQIPSGGTKFLMLHLSLWDQMRTYEREWARIDNDSVKISQLLFRLIQNTHCEQHVRDATPDCIADLLPEPYVSLNRVGSPIGSIHDQRLLKTYNKVLPKIEEYAATRLIF